MAAYNKVLTTVGHLDVFQPQDELVHVYFFWRDDAPTEVRAIRHVALWKADEGPTWFASARGAVNAIRRYCDNHPDIAAEYKRWADAACAYLKTTWEADCAAYCEMIGKWVGGFMALRIADEDGRAVKQQ